MERHEKQWPMPARYLINKEGVIRAADANADYAEPGASQTRQRVSRVSHDFLVIWQPAVRLKTSAPGRGGFQVRAAARGGNKRPL